MSPSKKLESEDEETRQQRIAALLAKTDISVVKSRTNSHAAIIPIGSRDQLPPLPTSSSSLLNRVKEFLPQLEAANKDIEQKLAENPQSLDIENINEDEGRYIEMDLGLGVFKQKREDGTVSSDEESDKDSEESNGSDDSSEDSSTDSSKDEATPVNERNIKPLPGRKGDKSQMIVELG